MDELAVKVATLEMIVTEKDAELENLKAQIEALKSAAPVAAGSLETFKDGKKNFQFTAPAFFWKGQKYTSAEAVKDKELLKALVEAKAGVIKEVQ